MFRRHVDHGGAARHDDDVPRIRLRRAVPLDVHRGDLAAGGAGLETADERVRHERDVRVRERRVDADHLGVGLGLDQARKAVAGVAPDAAARARVLLVEHEADRNRERPVSLADEAVEHRLDARLVADRRVAVGGARRRLGGIAAPQPVHVVEVLGLGVVGLEVLVADRPRGGDAAVVPHLAEVLLPHPEERRAVELGVPAHVVMGAGVKLPAVLVAPRLLDVVAALDDDGVRVPVRLLARDVAAPLEEEDALAGGGQAVGERAAPSARADDDDVVVIVRHQSSVMQWPASSHASRIARCGARRARRARADPARACRARRAARCRRTR